MLNRRSKQSHNRTREEGPHKGSQIYANWRDPGDHNRSGNIQNITRSNLMTKGNIGLMHALYTVVIL